ncbi:MAG: TPM domain-containing protein [Chthoniobacterales bacterium]
MRTKEFLSRLDDDEIVRAIRSAEKGSSGQIRVFVQRGKMESDPLEIAQKKFAQLGMEKTKERNGILIFVVPRARKFAVVGDEGVHAKCGPEFWQRLVAAMRNHFANENFTEALVEAIREAGDLLTRHFPRTSANANELPDEIIES